MKKVTIPLSLIGSRGLWSHGQRNPLITKEVKRLGSHCGVVRGLESCGITELASQVLVIHMGVHDQLTITDLSFNVQRCCRADQTPSVTKDHPQGYSRVKDMYDPLKYMAFHARIQVQD